MTPSERTGLAWLWILGAGETSTKQLAEAVDRSVRLVQLYTHQARAWLKRNRTPIETIMSPTMVDWCNHGLPIYRMEGDPIWVCLDCDWTNDPEHPDFHHGKLHGKNREGKPAEPEKPKQEAPTSVDQPKGKPKFKPRSKRAK